MLQAGGHQTKAKKARLTSIPARQTVPTRKASYLSAIGEYHAAMKRLSGGPQDNGLYGYELTCILADENETHASALSKALG